MPVERPTFSESWYRVAELRPRFRSTVQVHRQHFRGQLWHVVQDPANNQFFRLSDTAYHFVAMLDGRRTVAEVWQACNGRLGDSAPTQGEVIQLLGQLYTSNLLQAELAPDAESLFNRFKKRRTREVQSYLMNLLFVRFPLLDPDRFLDRWVGLFGWIFSYYGLAAWVVMIIAAGYVLFGRTSELVSQSAGVLDPSNLPLLYLSFTMIKVVHEFGHAFSCKKFGRLDGSGGEVHIMGVMFLVFTPMPYVDASSSWAFRSKWHRAIVGAGGMFVELGVAAMAALVWANTGQGTPVHAIAYNVMFIASVSTLIFNGNPLLRYDGYYILSDLLEIPNLAQRGKDYLYYLVRKYAWKVREARNPAHTVGERWWLGCYAVASSIYRIFISAAILLFVADKFFILGAILAVAAVIAWVLVPLGKFAHYLMTSGELARVRSRAIGSTLAALGGLVLACGVIPVPDRCRVEGVIEPADLVVVHAAADGFVRDYLPSGQGVTPDGPALVSAANPELSSQKEELLAKKRELEARYRQAGTQEPGAAQIMAEQLAALNEQLARVNQQLDSLAVHAPLAGTWVSPDIEHFKGAYVHRGDPVGLVASLDHMIVRATAGQDVAAMLITETARGVEIRLKDRPDLELSGTIRKILPAGQEHLPSAALGFSAGGSMETAPDDTKGLKAAERFFEIQVTPNTESDVRLLSGQRTVVRFSMPARPLVVQGWRALLQLIQKRFHT